MKLLFDENLSPWLATNLADLYPGSIHVRDVGLKSEPDQEIWQFAKANAFAIVTKDSDFATRTIFDFSAPVVIWIRLGNGSTRHLERTLRNHYETIRKISNTKRQKLLELR